MTIKRLAAVKTETTFRHDDLKVSKRARFYQPEEWPVGPWDNEPDKIVWVDPETDLDCMIVRNRMGALCGYVGVPKSHSMFEKNYDLLYDYETETGANIDVHGGLTYSSFCMKSEGAEEWGICHVPQQGRPDEIWWFGFDTAHLGDAVPGMMAMDAQYDLGLSAGARVASAKASAYGIGEDTYKDVPYVTEQVESLAKQLADAV